MWLVLDDSLVSYDLGEPSIHSGLEQVLYSVSLGRHAIAARREVLKHMLSFRFSPRPHAALIRAYESFSESLSASRESTYRVLITPTTSPPRRISENEWELPLHWIDENGIPDALILAENIRDSKAFYEAAHHSAIISRGWKWLSINLSNGGGADIHGVLNSKIASKSEFIICITDSDRCCPQAENNSTSKKCESAAYSSDWIVTHITLQEREIENLLPINIIEDVISEINCPDTGSRFLTLRPLATSSETLWMYLDLKNGTNLKSFLGPCSEYFRSTISRFDLSNLPPDCLSTMKCGSAAGSQCKCLFAPGLGERILEHTLNYLSRCSKHQAANRVRTSANAERWLQIGSLISSWGAATQKVRS